MSKLPLISGRDMIKLLGTVGLKEARTRGSHVVLAHSDGRRTVVPVHGGEMLGRGLIRAILRDAGLTVDDYVRLR